MSNIILISSHKVSQQRTGDDMVLRAWQAVYSYSKAACKCHGVSGSCSTRTCWNQQPTMRQVGGRLRQRHDGARLVAFNPHGTSLYPVATTSKTRRQNVVDVDNDRPLRRPRVHRRRRPTRDDLVYIDPSPDYCQPPDSLAEVTGATGTQGRRCQLQRSSSSTELNSCDQLCCGRGYNAHRWHAAERCHCRFHWCCYVKCQTCLRSRTIYTCK